MPGPAELAAKPSCWLLNVTQSGERGQAGGGAAAALQRQKSLTDSGVSSWQHNVAFLPWLRPSLCPVYHPWHCVLPGLHAVDLPP